MVSMLTPAYRAFSLAFDTSLLVEVPVTVNIVYLC